MGKENKRNLEERKSFKINMGRDACTCASHTLWLSHQRKKMKKPKLIWGDHSFPQKKLRVFLCFVLFFSFLSLLFSFSFIMSLRYRWLRRPMRKKKSKRNQCARIRSFRFFSLSISATESLAFVTRPLPLIDFHAISTLDLMARLSVMNDESRPVFPTHNSVLNYVIRMGRVEGT